MKSPKAFAASTSSLFGGNWVVGGAESLVVRLFRIYSARCYFGWHDFDLTHVRFD